jgi:hypothetical protein
MVEEPEGAVEPDESEADSAAPSRRVCDAFRLGWNMSRLYQQARKRERLVYRADPKPRSQSELKLPSQSELKSLVTERRLAAVFSGLHCLTDALEEAGFVRPRTGDLYAAYVEGAGAKVLAECTFRLHVATLLTLHAADQRLGSAYNLGRALAETGTEAEPETLQERFERNRIESMREALADLESAFPPHAGRTVGISLLYWQRVLPAHLKTRRDDAPKLERLLPRQAEVWRALLAGEKRGRDMLRTEHYVAAADRLADRAAEVAWSVIRAHWLPLAAGLAVVAAGLAVAVAVGGAGGTIGGIAAAAGAFGVSWRGVGSTLRALAAHLRAPLWGAQLDLAIADAITMRDVRDALSAAERADTD